MNFSTAMPPLTRLLDPEIFICGICGEEFTPAGRRPRAGFRPICSPECRKLMVLEANRASWHRNKSHYRQSQT